MQTLTHPGGLTPRLVLYSARTLTALWALLWAAFGLLSGLGEGMGVGGVVMHTVFPGLIFVLLFLLAWSWEVTGGIVLALIGMLIAAVYPFIFRHLPVKTIAVADLAMAAPPLLAGILFLAHWRPGKRKTS